MAASPRCVHTSGVYHPVRCIRVMFTQMEDLNAQLYSKASAHSQELHS